MAEIVVSFQIAFRVHGWSRELSQFLLVALADVAFQVVGPGEPSTTETLVSLDLAPAAGSDHHIAVAVG